MSKLIKVVAGVALVAVGVATGNFQLAFLGLSLAGGTLLAPKNPARDRAASAATLQVGEVPRQAILGRAAVAGSLVDAFNYGGKNGTDWEVLVIALADHRCDALEGMFVNDTFVAFAADGAVAGFSGQLEVYWRPGTATQTVPAVLTANGPGWTANDRGKGVAWVTVAYKADAADAKNPVWPGGRPRFRWVVRGLRCYDPRKDTTAGGAGAHRWADPATWEWSENPIVARYNWVRGIFATDLVAQPEMLLVGRGLSEIEAPAANLFARANLCDEVVGAEARYRIGGLVAASEAYIDVENDIAAACAGTIVQPEGSVEIDPGEARAPVTSFTDDDLIVGSKVSWSDFLGTGDADWINTAVATFTDPGQGWKERSAPPRRDLADIAADGSPREAQIRLVLVSWMAQAQRVAEIARRFGRLWGRGQVTLPPRFAGIEEGDWVTWQSDRHFGGATLTFRVEAWGSDQAWHHQLTLRQISASVYSDTAPLDDGSVAAQQDAPGDVPAPAPGAWALAVGTTGVGGAETPVLVVTGATDDPDARLVRMEYFQGALPPGVGEVWTDAGAVGPEVVRREIPVVVAGSYYVAVSYVIGGTTGDRLVLGPVSTTAQLAGKATTFRTAPPATPPTMALDLLRSEIIDPRLTFSRASTATYWGGDGRLKTAAVNEPRFDHDPLTGEPLGLLLEPFATTNLLLRSEELDDAAWQKLDVTITPNAELAPDGTMTADKMVESVGLVEPRAWQQITGTVGATYTYSCFLKAAGRSFAEMEITDGTNNNRVRAIFDLATGVVASAATNGGNASGAQATISHVGGGIHRCAISGSPSSAGTTKLARTTIRNTGSGGAYTGNGTSGLFAWGAQLEVRSFATSYVRTTTAAVTRSSDVASVDPASMSSALNASAGAVFSEFIPTGLTATGPLASVVSLNDGTGSNVMNIREGTVIAGVDYTVFNGGVIQVDSASFPLVVGQSTRMAFAYAANDFILAKDGVLGAQDASGSVPPVDRIRLLGQGHYRDVRYYPARLPDAELQSLTAFPVAEAAGDVWVDASAGNRTMIADASLGWVLSRDGAVNDAWNKLGPIEDNADVTKVVKELPPEIVIQYNFDGTAKDGELPRAVAVKLFTSGGVQITSGITWSVETVSGTIARSISGTGTGNLSITSLTSQEAVITIKALVNGQSYFATTSVSKLTDPPPPPSGETGPQSASISGTIASSGAYITVATMAVVAGAGGTIQLRAANVTLRPAVISSDTATDIKSKLQWESSPSTWTDLGSVTFSDPDPTEADLGDGFWGKINGLISADPFDHTGRTNGVSYNYRLQMAYNSGALRSVNPTGTMTGTPT